MYINDVGHMTDENLAPFHRNRMRGIRCRLLVQPTLESRHPTLSLEMEVSQTAAVQRDSSVLFCFSSYLKQRTSAKWRPNKSTCQLDQATRTGSAHCFIVDRSSVGVICDALDWSVHTAARLLVRVLTARPAASSVPKWIPVEGGVSSARQSAHFCLKRHA
ncbi:unnamed protein product [Protopolystoma xenopodis]|uniref:Uncharacterized protein n=1 Tax=Protopolystoma xenopodis TaxID=117903 RepID=A0A448XJ34_9PLAT|nr:unnamed protein product [Protopolystoma xenopodis]